MEYRVLVQGDLVVDAENVRDAEYKVELMLQDKASWLTVSPSSARPIGVASQDLLDRLESIGES